MTPTRAAATRRLRKAASALDRIDRDNFKQLWRDYCIAYMDWLDVVNP